MGRKKVSATSASKSKEAFIDKEEVLEDIRNLDYLAMKTAREIWPEPTTTEKDLHDLVDDDLMEA